MFSAPPKSRSGDIFVFLGVAGAFFSLLGVAGASFFFFFNPRCGGTFHARRPESHCIGSHDMVRIIINYQHYFYCIVIIVVVILILITSS